MISSSMTAFSVFISLIIFSILIANFANLINIDNEIDDQLKKSIFKRSNDLQISDKADHLMWFVQISDLHISYFSAPDRIEQFKEFVNNTIDIIKPSVVLATGDLTDGREENILGSKQILNEWKIYKGILDDNKITNKTLWLDIRGNHDTFNIPDLKSKQNFFLKYSIQGNKHPRSYLYQIDVGSDRYSFIAIDATLERGIKRTLNFIGLLDKDEINKIINLNDIARKNGGNYTIWFGHYPTSCILSGGTGKHGIRKIIGNYDESYVYLNGHLHTQGGLSKKMYTLHKEGFLELELGDWKSSRLYRIAAFDHGLLSVVDLKYNDYPIILITNPKDALLNIPQKENINLQLNSTHIRLLIFSPSKVIYCGIKIKNDQLNDCEAVNDNLFVTPWKPEKYKNGIQYLTVNVKTKDGKSKEIIHPFSLDGSRLNFDLLGRFVLMSDLTQLFQILFGFALCLCVVPICIIRFLHELVIAGKLKRPRIRKFWLKNHIKKIWIFTTIDRIFMPYILHCIYLAFGPWSFADAIDNYWTVVFVWGIFVNDAFIPGTLTYLYGFFELCFCHFPLIFVYTSLVYNRYLNVTGENRNSKIINYFTHIPFITIVFVQILCAIMFWWLNGTFAFIFGPLRTWSIIIYIILFYLSRRIPEKCFQPALMAWNP